MNYNPISGKNELIVYNELGDIFERHNSDKHHLDYHTWYVKYLPEVVGDFLEIGTWKGGGIFSFKEWYKDKGRFFAMNYVFGGEIISKDQLKANDIIPLEGNQSDLEFLKGITQKFDVIIDDGSHHSDEQVITFAAMFENNLRENGVYIIEDLHCCKQEYWWRVIKDFNDTALALVKRAKDGITWESQLINTDKADYLWQNISQIELPSDSIVFIWKGKNSNPSPKPFIHADSVQGPV